MAEDDVQDTGLTYPPHFVGTYFYHAAMEGLLKNDTNIHAGIRTTLSGMSDYENDGYVGFEIVEAREIDTIGTAGIIKKIHDRVGKCHNGNVGSVTSC